MIQTLLNIQLSAICIWWKKDGKSFLSKQTIHHEWPSWNSLGQSTSNQVKLNNCGAVLDLLLKPLSKSYKLTKVLQQIHLISKAGTRYIW